MFFCQDIKSHLEVYWAACLGETFAWMFSTVMWLLMVQLYIMKAALWTLCLGSCSRNIRPQKVLWVGGNEGDDGRERQEGLQGPGRGRQRLHRGGGAQVRKPHSNTETCLSKHGICDSPLWLCPQVCTQGLLWGGQRPDRRRDKSLPQGRRQRRRRQDRHRRWDTGRTGRIRRATHPASAWRVRFTACIPEPTVQSL